MRGRMEVELRLTKQLGLDSVKTLREYIATFRNLTPEARSMAAKLTKQGKLRVKWLRDIRKLDEQGQMAALHGVERASDVQDADRQLDTFFVGKEIESRQENQNKERRQPQSRKPTLPMPTQDAPHYVKGKEIKVRQIPIESLQHGGIWFHDEGKLVNLKDLIQEQVIKHANTGDLINAHLF